MALTNQSVAQYLRSIDLYTKKLNSEGQSLTDAKTQSTALVNSMVDDSIAINQKIEAAVIASRTPQTTPTVP